MKIAYLDVTVVVQLGVPHVSVAFVNPADQAIAGEHPHVFVMEGGVVENQDNFTTVQFMNNLGGLTGVDADIKTTCCLDEDPGVVPGQVTISGISVANQRKGK